jgi:hypothetical protein
MRPDLISQLHGAFLDTKQQPGSEELAQRYELLLSQAIAQYGCTRAQLILALQSDFHKWQEDEGLKPRRRR